MNHLGPEQIIVVTASILISIIAAYLIWDRDYEDGIVGRIALGILSAAGGLLARETYTEALSLTPALTVIVFATALFFARHIFRFIGYRRSGSNSWRPASK